METPKYFHGGYYRNTHHSTHPEILRHDSSSSKLAGGCGGDHFVIDDLLDFSNAEVEGGGNTFGDNSTDSNSVVTAVDSCNSSFCGTYDTNNHSNDNHLRNFPEHPQFSNDLCVPYDELVELEWLSNIGEETFSTEDLQKLQLISGMQARTNSESETRGDYQAENNRNNPTFRPEMQVPGKARSKRNRAVPSNWSSRLLVLSPTTSSSESDINMSNSSGKSTPKSSSKKKDVISSSASNYHEDRHQQLTHQHHQNMMAANNSDGRKCLHCQTDKTPQWRTGPMGPKTLCNACGVRYKSGRLVPEYRPAASPTFVLTQHSNSHRKVLELRRQKEMQRSVHPHHHHHHHHHHQNQYLHPSNNMYHDDSSCDDYLIHHHVGPDYRQLI
ncbi:hypothetical protein MKW94_016438 [Papaver nudicaule]|uniref:GATA transcription factor n=1 Tax=Papaver nudicaule TaxID=74823 RepID=A0AA41UZC2_PAPNU|nr:hypothetical protein [Papaver nudicaule]